MFRHHLSSLGRTFLASAKNLKSTIHESRVRNITYKCATNTNKKEEAERKFDGYTEIQQSDGIRLITLSNVKSCNALSMPMMDSILKGITYDWNDESLRCIILTAKGPVWSAGHDLKELASASKSFQRDIINKLTQIIFSIQKAPIPVIARVNGLAAAAGCQLAVSCDMLVASNQSKFSTPGAKFGIFCSTPGVAIKRAMGSHSKAAYMLMTSLPITAEEAHGAGLVTRLVPESKLEDEMKTITDAIIQQSRSVVAFGKEIFYKQIQINDLKEAYKCASEAMVENLQMADGKEGVKSFAQKRAPIWKHK